MKKMCARFAMFVVVGSLLAVSCSSSPESEGVSDAQSVVKLSFSTWHPPMSKEVKTVWEPMLAELGKRSKGRIKCTLHAGGALGSGPEHFDIVAKGLSDMGYFTATWTPGRFPLSDVLSTAVSVNGKDVATDIGNAVYKKVLTDEFAGVKVIQLNGCIQAFLWTRKPVRTLDDCKGLRIRSPGGQQSHYIKALGAEPVFMPLGDVYLAMETGTIDGIVTCPSLVLAFRLHEVAKHGVMATFGCVTEGVVMNQKKWDELPEDLKNIVIAVCSNPYRTTGGLNTEVYASMVDQIREKGVDLKVLPEAEEARWFALFQDETRKWVRELENKGLPAAQAIKVYCEEASRHGIECASVPHEYDNQAKNKGL